MKKERVKGERILLKKSCNQQMWYWINDVEFRKILLLDAMKEEIKQALVLAAENAKGRDVYDDFDGSYDCIIIKESITKTINQIL